MDMVAGLMGCLRYVLQFYVFEISALLIYLAIKMYILISVDIMVAG